MQITQHNALEMAHKSHEAVKAKYGRDHFVMMNLKSQQRRKITAAQKKERKIIASLNRSLQHHLDRNYQDSLPKPDVKGELEVYLRPLE